MTGMIFDIQEMTFHDGPGGRITVFFKGCPLECSWCHNPEGQKMNREILYKESLCIHCNRCFTANGINPESCVTQARSWCGQFMSSDELIDKILPLKDMLEMMEGGVTFSGGEPCAQAEFLIDCLIKLKKEGIHTAIETSGYCDSDQFEMILNYCDYVLMDLKIMDDELHRKYTGQSNELILKNAQTLMSKNIPFIFRTPLIPGITDSVSNLQQIQQFIHGSPWEKLAYNPLTPVKYQQLNRSFQINKVK